ncbi:hypothetical protein ACOACQ_15085 [Nocardioides sp. CPCC 206347]|uniref:hypothetical protein n=1 Tax=unclassified Nocardioides TaxID=2615069 RepID=UPI00362260D9
MEPEGEVKPGNWYEELLWDIAGGPVSVGRFILGWILLLAVALLAANLSGTVSDPLSERVVALVSIPYWLLVCPGWALLIRRRRDRPHSSQ